MASKDIGYNIIYLQPGTNPYREIKVKELRIIVYDYLQLAPMYESLVFLLKKYNKIPQDSDGETGELRCWDALEILNSVEFLNETARVTKRSLMFIVHQQEKHDFKYKAY